MVCKSLETYFQNREGYQPSIVLLSAIKSGRPLGHHQFVLSGGAMKLIYVLITVPCRLDSVPCDVRNHQRWLHTVKVD